MDMSATPESRATARKTGPPWPKMFRAEPATPAAGSGEAARCSKVLSVARLEGRSDQPIKRPLGRFWRAGSGGHCHFRVARHLRVVAAVRAGLRPRLTARKRQPQDRALHRAQLRQERTGVVREAVALADLSNARRDLGVP